MFDKIKLRNLLGARGGSVVELRAPKRDVQGQPHDRRILPLSKTHYWLIPRERWSGPKMAEKLLTGTLNKTQTKRNARFCVFDEHTCSSYSQLEPVAVASMMMMMMMILVMIVRSMGPRSLF